MTVLGPRSSECLWFGAGPERLALPLGPLDLDRLRAERRYKLGLAESAPPPLPEPDEAEVARLCRLDEVEVSASEWEQHQLTDSERQHFDEHGFVRSTAIQVFLKHTRIVRRP